MTTTDAESHSRAFPGVELDVVQTGRGVGPNSVRAMVFDDATFCVGSVDFPVRGETTISDGYLIAAVVSSAPPGTRWCGYDIAAGDALLYAPGSEHTGASPVGTRYTAAIVRQQSIEETADVLQTRIRIPANGSVQSIRALSTDRSIASALTAMLLVSPNDEAPEVLRRDILQILTSTLGGDIASERTSIRESRGIVRRCSEFVHDQGGAPSIGSLCEVAHVSERRLRSAFIQTYGQPPIKYFIEQRLNQARAQLLASEPRHRTVTDVAFDLGFRNGGRFSSQYTELFGELPSETLRYAV